ncbi:MAG: choice-of-anchor R domain-containing protein [Chthoniobacterales bacterium]
MRRNVWVFVAIVVSSLATAATTASAAIILGNYPPGSSSENPGPDIGFGGQQAVKFTMGSSSTPLSNVILRVHTSSSGPNVPAIDIRNDAGTDPGTSVLFTIEGTTNLAPNGMFDQPEDYTLTATSSFTLAANTTYWLVVRAKSGSFEWWRSNPTITPSGSLADYLGERSTFNDGTSWSDPFASKNSFQMNTGVKNALLNVSTRLQVGTGDNVLIGGLILTGSGNKTVILRAIGPSLAGIVPGAMSDPQLELFDGANASIGRNDNWKTTQIGGVITGDQVAAIQASGVAPTNDAESALIATLPSGNYTAVLRGANNATGIAVVEGYDLAQSTGKIGNISTRGFVQTGDGAMIGGFIIGNQTTKVVVRAIGPSLSAFGVPTPLANPTLELRDANANLLDSNNNWKVRDSDGASQQATIEATGLAPTNDLESTLVTTVPPGNYTGIVRGVNNGVGNAVVEAYNLQ